MKKFFAILVIGLLSFGVGLGGAEIVAEQPEINMVVADEPGCDAQWLNSHTAQISGDDCTREYIAEWCDAMSRNFACCANKCYNWGIRGKFMVLE